MLTSLSGLGLFLGCFLPCYQVIESPECRDDQRVRLPRRRRLVLEVVEERARLVELRDEPVLHRRAHRHHVVALEAQDVVVCEEALAVEGEDGCELS